MPIYSVTSIITLNIHDLCNDYKDTSGIKEQKKKIETKYRNDAQCRRIPMKANYLISKHGFKFFYHLFSFFFILQ